MLYYIILYLYYNICYNVSYYIMLSFIKWYIIYYVLYIIYYILYIIYCVIDYIYILFYHILNYNIYTQHCQTHPCGLDLLTSGKSSTRNLFGAFGSPKPCVLRVPRVKVRRTVVKQWWNEYTNQTCGHLSRGNLSCWALDIVICGLVLVLRPYVTIISGSVKKAVPCYSTAFV